MRHPDSDELFTLLLSKKWSRKLQPKAGEPVFAGLKRVKAFAEDYLF
jgi:hypothetical protein